MLDRILSFIHDKLIDVPIYYGHNVTNLNDKKKAGSGYTNSATGVPSGVGNGQFIVFPSGGNVIVQFYIPYNSGVIWIRFLNGSTWGNWVKN